MENNRVFFEDDYIFRNNRSITTNNDIALTEFVANAWDAGAHNVDITIPLKENEEICVKDDGTVMSVDEFINSLMKLIFYGQNRHG